MANPNPLAGTFNYQGVPFERSAFDDLLEDPISFELFAAQHESRPMLTLSGQTETYASLTNPIRVQQGVLCPITRMPIGRHYIENSLMISLINNPGMDLRSQTGVPLVEPVCLVALNERDEVVGLANQPYFNLEEVAVKQADGRYQMAGDRYVLKEGVEGLPRLPYGASKWQCIRDVASTAFLAKRAEMLSAHVASGSGVGVGLASAADGSDALANAVHLMASGALEQSVAGFKRVIAHSRADNLAVVEAHWYLANHYFETGQYVLANQHLTPVSANLDRGDLSPLIKAQAFIRQGDSFRSQRQGQQAFTCYGHASELLRSDIEPLMQEQWSAMISVCAMSSVKLVDFARHSYFYLYALENQAYALAKDNEQRAPLIDEAIGLAKHLIQLCQTYKANHQDLTDAGRQDVNYALSHACLAQAKLYFLRRNTGDYGLAQATFEQALNYQQYGDRQADILHLPFERKFISQLLINNTSALNQYAGGHANYLYPGQSLTAFLVHNKESVNVALGNSQIAHQVHQPALVEAKQLALKYLAKYPQQPSILMSLSQVMALLDEPARAYHYAKRALAVTPKNTDIQLQLVGALVAVLQSGAQLNAQQRRELAQLDTDLKGKRLSRPQHSAWQKLQPLLSVAAIPRPAAAAGAFFQPPRAQAPVNDGVIRTVSLADAPYRYAGQWAGAIGIRDGQGLTIYKDECYGHNDRYRLRLDNEAVGDLVVTRNQENRTVTYKLNIWQRVQRENPQLVNRAVGLLGQQLERVCRRAAAAAPAARVARDSFLQRRAGEGARELAQREDDAIDEWYRNQY